MEHDIPWLKVTVLWVVKWKDVSIARNALVDEVYQVLRTKGEIVIIGTMGLDEYCQELLIY